MRFAVDSNVLVYALDSSDTHRHAVAARIMEQAPLLDCVLPAQCLAEFLNVVRRKHPGSLATAVELATRWARTMAVLPTGAGHVLAGANLAARYKLQLFDSIIWQVAQAAGATVLLSEDFQDGFATETLSVIDPFEPGNRSVLESLLVASESGK